MRGAGIRKFKYARHRLCGITQRCPVRAGKDDVSGGKDSERGPWRIDDLGYTAAAPVATKPAETLAWVAMPPSSPSLSPSTLRAPEFLGCAFSSGFQTYLPQQIGPLGDQGFVVWLRFNQVR